MDEMGGRSGGAVGEQVLLMSPFKTDGSDGSDESAGENDGDDDW